MIQRNNSKIQSQVVSRKNNVQNKLKQRFSSKRNANDKKTTTTTTTKIKNKTKP